MKRIEQIRKEVQAYNKIVACIDSCETLKQLLSCDKMMNTFGKRFPETIDKQPFSLSYRDKLRNRWIFKTIKILSNNE